MEKTKLDTEKPNWIAKLEQESWQAELIISGAAIIGTLQLPSLVDQFGEWSLIYFSEDLSLVLILLLFFLYFICGSLITGFILHFILRGVWIGLIGLNSVFPEGIKTENGWYSKIFMEKFKADYDVKNFGIETLDKFCSGIFGFCTLMTLISLTLITGLLFCYGIYAILSMFLSFKTIELIAKWLFGLMLIPSIISLIFLHKRFEHNQKIQGLQYKFMNLSTMIVYHIFRRPINYLTFLFQTNIELKQYFSFGYIILFLLISFTTYSVETSCISFIGNRNAFQAYYARGDEAVTEIYEEHLTKESLPIYSTIIPSKLIEGRMMNVFIPIFPNEKNIYTNFCGDFLPVEGISKDEKKKAAEKFYIDCYQKYHRIYINDQIQNVELVKFTHPHRSTEGVTTYVPTKGFIEGEKNILKVEKMMKGDSVYRTMIVPFWFGGE